VWGGYVSIQYHRGSVSQWISYNGISVMATHDSYNIHWRRLSFVFWTATNRELFRKFLSHLNDDCARSRSWGQRSHW